MRRLALLAGLTATVAASGAAAAQAAAPVKSCAARTATVRAGAAVRLALDCAVRSAGRTKTLARGRTGGAVRSVTTKPKHGTLSSLNARTGTVVYRPRTAYAGPDTVVARLRFPDGRRYRVTIRITVRKPATPVPRPGATVPAAPPVAPEPPPAEPAPTADPPAAPPTSRPEIPDPLPLAANAASAANNWAPLPTYPTLHADTDLPTCPKELHDRFAVIGPDGKRYPTWHPPTVTDPGTGQRCTFGHEHGRDPRGSAIYDWVAAHFAAPGEEAYAGIPFGLSTEALSAWRADGHDTPARSEDNPGYKVDYRNDAELFARDGRDLGVSCDSLVSYHQGSHSADATSNNVHELLYAVRCSDGTQLVSTTVARYGRAGEYTRGCDDSVTVATADNGYPAGAGRRLIPDRACVDTNFLVPPGRTTSAYALWEQWIADNTLHTGHDGEGSAIASYYTRLDVFDPARYADPDPSVVPTPGSSTRIGRPLDLCWATSPTGNRVDRKNAPCGRATEGWTVPASYDYRDPQSPFNGTTRDVRLRNTTVRNAGGPSRWYTDPYGGNASTTPFPGAICQLVGSVDNAAQPPVQDVTSRSPVVPFSDGVHAPN